MLEVSDITFSYEKHKNVLEKVSFKLEKGRMLVVCGKSGVGKSTLLRIGGGVIAPNEGKVFYDEIDLFALSQKERDEFRKKKIGYIEQEPYLFEGINTLDNVCIPTIIKDKKCIIPEIYERGRTALERIGLSDYASVFPNQLSGGERRRLEMARFLLYRPDYLFLDEPTGNLDDECVYLLLEIFDEFMNAGTSLIVSTHDQRIKSLKGIERVCL